MHDGCVMDHDARQTDMSTTPETRTAIDRATGLDIRIDRMGEGPPIVFLNGLLGLNEHWFGCLPPLAARAECLLLQPPLLEMKGKGCSVEGVLHLIASLLQTLIDQPAILVGNSLGGHLALRMSLSNPEMVRGLVLVGSSGLFERTFEKDVQHSPSREWLNRKISELFCDPAKMRPGMVDMAYAELSRRSAARALVKLGRSAKNDHLGDVLHRITTPTLLVWGTHDIVTPPEVGHQFHALMPNSRLVMIDRCGHAPQIECPVELSAATLDFLTELGSSREQQEVA